MLMLSAGTAMAEKRVALVIANQNYGDAPLVNPINDAKIIAPALEDIGFDVETHLDVADTGTFARIISRFLVTAEGADVALFYYAGHGFAVNNAGDVGSTNYLMTTAADLTSSDEFVLRSGGVALDDIVSRLSTVAKVTLFFIDACRNDPYEVARGRGRSRSLGAIDMTQNEVLVVSSTRLGTTASDDEGEEGTKFARSLAANIKEPGRRIEDVFNAVRRDVEKGSGNTQSPELMKYDLDEPLVLVPAAVVEIVPPDDVTPPERLVPECVLLAQPDAPVERLLLIRTREALLACRKDVRANPDDAELQRLLEIVTEQDETAAALQSNDLVVLRGYVDAYPNGRYVEDIRTRLANLQPEPPAVVDGREEPAVVDPVPLEVREQINAAVLAYDTAVADAARDYDASVKVASASEAEVRKLCSSAGLSELSLCLGREFQAFPKRDPEKLALLIQTELERAGCEPGALDGDWGSRSTNAAERFLKEQPAKVAASQPSEDLLSVLRETSGRICPEVKEPRTSTFVVCKKGQKLSNGKCVSTGGTAGGKTEKRITPKPTSPCFIFKGVTVCE